VTSTTTSGAADGGATTGAAGDGAPLSSGTATPGTTAR
jgi:hypothetical protein